MRSIQSLAAVLLLTLNGGALAQAPNDNPNSTAAQATAKAGWKMEAGIAAHEMSMTKCPAELAGLGALIFTGPSDPNIVGTCTYKDPTDSGDAGIQVRRYMRDIGESREAIVNDRTLMEPRPGAEVPFMMVRLAPITLRNGKSGGRMVITKTRGGLLIDCFGEGESLEKTSAKIGLFCGGN